MASRTKPQPTADELKDYARGLIKVARDNGMVSLRAEFEYQGETRVEVIVERSTVMSEPAPEDDSLPEIIRTDEHVTVKVGPKTAPRTVVAAPASWLDG